MEKTWDLSILYDGFDDEKYANGKKALEKSYAARVARVEKEAE